MVIVSAKTIAQLSVLAACGIANASSLSRPIDLEPFVQKERAIALQGVLNNIGPHGSRAPGVGAGVIIASPSTVDPNCEFANNLLDQIADADKMIDFYTWSRDAALTMRVIVDEFLLGKKQLQSYIEDYIHSQAVLQYETLSPLNHCLAYPASINLLGPKIMEVSVVTQPILTPSLVQVCQQPIWYISSQWAWPRRAKVQRGPHTI